MATVTYDQLKREIAKTISILIIILGFAIYKMFKNQVNTEYYILAIGSFLCIVGNTYFSIKSTKMLVNKSLAMNLFEVSTLRPVLIIVQGLIPIYLFFYKGLFGIYLLFDSFDWFLLFFRLIIIVISYHLTVSVGKIQDALKWLSQNTWQKIG